MSFLPYLRVGVVTMQPVDTFNEHEQAQSICLIRDTIELKQIAVHARPIYIGPI